MYSREKNSPTFAHRVSQRSDAEENRVSSRPPLSLADLTPRSSRALSVRRPAPSSRRWSRRPPCRAARERGGEVRFSRDADASDGKKSFSVRGTVASGHPDSWHPSRSDSRAGARGGRLAAGRVAERTSLGVWLGLIREPSNRKRTASGCSALREQKALKIWREGSASGEAGGQRRVRRRSRSDGESRGRGRDRGREHAGHAPFRTWWSSSP